MCIPRALQAFLVYVAAFFGNVGNYRSFGDTKIIPGCSEEEFLKILRSSDAFKTDSEGLEKLYAATDGRMFSLSPREAQLGMAPTGTTTYYSSNVTKEEAAAVQEYMDDAGISGYTLRFLCAPTSQCHL